MDLIVKLEGFNYVVYNGKGEDADELDSFNVSRMGDQVAREMADAYKKGYEAGYSQAEIDGQTNEDEERNDKVGG